MSAAYALVILGCSAVLAVGAERRGSWSASSSAGQNFGGSWTAEAHQESGGVTGSWALYDASGKILLRGGWSASKSTQAWNGAWRATVTGRDGSYSGTWTATTPLPSKLPMIDMLESALRAVLTGTWKSGAHSGSWSIRAFP
jgi:hypothetical protein